MTNIRLLTSLLAFGVISTVIAAEPPLARFTFAEPHMGTRFKIVLYAADEKTAQSAQKAAFERIAQLDRTMSDYQQSSELMQVCRRAGGPPERVSADLFEVLSRAKTIARLSDGAFDVSVGPVVRLWRRSRKTQQMPPADKLAEALALVGYRNIGLDEKNQTVRLAKPGMQLDLGGIAKGYSADAALEVLRAKGCARALVAAGGDIAVSDPPPENPGWKIGIAPLEDPNRKPSRYLVLHNQAVSTSGDVEQSVEINGKRYSHIVDPRTGVGLVGHMSVTVVAPRGVLSDSLTKVVSVLGPQRGFAILDQIEGVASLVVRQGEKGEEVFASKRFGEIPQVKE
jgi:thiamine biosynthesis lipoprotein